MQTFFEQMLAYYKILCTFASLLKRSTPKKSFGEVAEWSIAAVLKTVVLRGTRGSNPCLSAEKSCKTFVLQDFLLHTFLFKFQTSNQSPNSPTQSTAR